MPTQHLKRTLGPRLLCCNLYHLSTKKGDKIKAGDWMWFCMNIQYPMLSQGFCAVYVILCLERAWWTCFSQFRCKFTHSDVAGRLWCELAMEKVPEKSHKPLLLQL